MSSTYEIILKATDQYSSEINKFQSKIKDTKDKVDDLGKTNKTMGSSMGTIFSAANIGLAATLGLIGKSVSEANESQRTLKEISSIIKITGNAAGQTTDSVSELAEKFSKITKFDDDEILGGQKTLLQFERIGKDLFPQATEAMLDFATASGTDASTAAATLGKALENPVEATNLLKKAKITLTDAQQAEIEKLQKSGQLYAAQMVIMNQVKASIGGLAKDSMTPLDQLKNMFGDLFKVVGEVLMPAVNDLIKAFLPLGEFIKNNAKSFVIYGTAIATVAALLFGGPLSIGVAIGLLIAALYSLRNNWDEILNKMKLMAVNFAISVAETFRDAFKSLGLDSWVEEADEALADLNKLKADYNAQEKVFAAERAKLKKEEEDKKKKAEEDSIKAQIKAAKDAKAAANKQETDKENDELKKRYGFVDNALKADIKLKEKADQAKARQELKDETKVIKDKERLRAKYTKFSEKQIDAIYSAEQSAKEEDEQNEVKRQMFIEGIGNVRMEYTQQLLGNLSSLQNSKTREFFEVGKAASIAQATINTYEGASKALSAYPPPFSFIAAAAQVAAGIANVQQISSTEFADGGFMDGNTAFRGNALMGEAGPEVVLPLRTDGPGVRYLSAALKEASKNQEQSRGNSIYSPTYTITLNGGDEKQVSKIKKVIREEEKRKLRKEQFVKGRF